MAKNMLAFSINLAPSGREVTFLYFTVFLDQTSCRCLCPLLTVTCWFLPFTHSAASLFLELPEWPHAASHAPWQ